MVGGAGADDSTRGERAVVSMMQACGAERAAGGRRGGRCFCSAASSAEKRGELGGDPPPPPFPLRSGPCGRQLRKEMVAERWRGEVTSTRPPVLPPPTPRAHTAEPSVSTMHGVVAWRAERMGREGCGGIEIRGRKHARDTAVLGWSRAGWGQTRGTSLTGAQRQPELLPVFKTDFLI